MTDQNWRTEVNALDYLGHQQKALQLADRRPVIRKASDLVGPGIGSNAVQITDFNDLLATFNGYYAAAPGAQHAPTDGQGYTGFTVSEGVMGGSQVFYGLTDGRQYHRVFTRNERDPATLYWGSWTPAVSSADMATLQDRTSVLEGKAAAVHPLYTGSIYYWLTNGPPGYSVSGIAYFGMTFPTVPACWAVKADPTSGSNDIVVAMVDQVTTTSARITILNAGPNTITFEDMRVRWFAQEATVLST